MALVSDSVKDIICLSSHLLKRLILSEVLINGLKISDRQQGVNENMGKKREDKKRLIYRYSPNLFRKIGFIPEAILWVKLLCRFRKTVNNGFSGEMNYVVPDPITFPL